MTLRYCGNRGNRNMSGKHFGTPYAICVEKLKFQQQILKYFDVFQGAGRSYGGGVVHIVSQEPQSNTRHPQKSPNLQTWEMWANMFHTKICNHNCWSEVAGPIHRGVEKPQKPPNLQPHLCAFGQILKKITFLQHVRVLLLSFKANLQVKCSQDHQMTWNPIIVLRQN